MPIILTTQAEVETWLTRRPRCERPLPNGAPKIIAPSPMAHPRPRPTASE